MRLRDERLCAYWGEVKVAVILEEVGKLLVFVLAQKRSMNLWGNWELLVVECCELLSTESGLHES